MTGESFRDHGTFHDYVFQDKNSALQPLELREEA